MVPLLNYFNFIAVHTLIKNLEARLTKIEEEIAEWKNNSGQTTTQPQTTTAAPTTAAPTTAAPTTAAPATEGK